MTVAWNAIGDTPNKLTNLTTVLTITDLWDLVEQGGASNYPCNLESNIQGCFSSTVTAVAHCPGGSNVVTGTGRTAFESRRHQKLLNMWVALSCEQIPASLHGKR